MVVGSAARGGGDRRGRHLYRGSDPQDCPPVDGPDYGRRLPRPDRITFRHEARGSAVPSERRRRLFAWRRASCIDRNEEHPDETGHADSDTK